MNVFLNWDDLEFKKTGGHEKLRCPACTDSRSDKKDRSLIVYHDDGCGKCFYCGALVFRKKDESGPTTKTYTHIEQTWQNHTALNEKLVKYCGTRKISQRVLIEMGITQEPYYQPALQKTVSNLVFNYFEGELIVNKKFRSGDKKFTQITGGKPILYNINAAVGVEELWIVEGEFDVLALKEIGINNVTSLPNGANDNNEYWANSEKYLKNVKKFIIGTDNDEKGLAVRDRIAQRLGRYKCSYVEWEGKDANDDLVSGCILKTVKNLKRFPVGGTFTSEDIADKVLQLYHNGLPSTIKPKGLWLKEMSDVFSVMRGHLTVITGIPSHGKSSLTDWYLLNLVYDHNYRLSVFSPEHAPLELHASNFTRMALGKPFWGQGKASEDDVKRYLSWSNERIYFTTAENGEFPNWDWLFEKFKEQIYAYGIDVFLIDAFNKVDGSDTLQELRKVLGRLTLFCQMHNVIIFLVAHPTKMKMDDSGRYKVPTLYDVSGSADFRNQAHDGYTVYRDKNEEEDKTTVYVMKLKYEWQGDSSGSADFYYDKGCARFYPTSGYKCNIDFTTGLEIGMEASETPRDYKYPDISETDLVDLYRGERTSPF